jgi:hypothetical protein
MKSEMAKQKSVEESLLAKQKSLDEDLSSYGRQIKELQ